MAVPRSLRLAAFGFTWLALLALASCGNGTPTPLPLSHTEQCGAFAMPNPVAAALPNAATYTSQADGTILDDVTGLTWQLTIDPTARPSAEAATVCAALGAGWRVPTRLELLSLVDYTIAAPGPTINPIFKDTPATVFWTSSPYAGDAGDAWTIGFDAGYTDYGVRDAANLVRCVSGPAASCPSGRYDTSKTGLVVDRATGLVWQRVYDPGSYTWSDALAHCTGLGTGWRLPSLTELQTIIDDAKEYPAVDVATFPGTPSEVFWSASQSAESDTSSWVVDFFYGATDRDVPARLYHARCVR